jgi:hypothetical protein
MARRERRPHLVTEDDGITSIFTTFTNISVTIWQCFTSFVNFVSTHLLRLSSACHPCSCWAFNQVKNLQDRGESPHQELTNHLKFTKHVRQGTPSSSSSSPCVEDKNHEPQPIVSNNVTELISYETVQFGLQDMARKFAKELCNGNLPNLKSLNMIVNYAQDCGDEVARLREVVRSGCDTISTLHLELEEERNASASATNETMAMIARLQEEKAAIQMEARQYKRMAEEKALYDQEAMDMLKEVIAKREEELQLEYEDNKHSYTSFTCVQGGQVKELLYLKGEVPSANDDQMLSPQSHDWDAQSTKEFVQGLLSYFKNLNAKEQNMIREVIYNSKTPYHSSESNQHLNLHSNDAQARNSVSMHNYDDNGVTPLLPNDERDGGGNEYMCSGGDEGFHQAKMGDKDAPISQKKLEDYDDKAKEQNSEERKMSVLEYVLKFEEQFHELEQKKNKGVKGVRALCDQKDNTQSLRGISKRNHLKKELVAKPNEVMIRPNTEDLTTATPSEIRKRSDRNDLGDDLCEEVTVEEVSDVVDEPMTVCPRVKRKLLEKDEDVAPCPSNSQRSRIVEDGSQTTKGDSNWEDLETSRSASGIVEERSHTNRVKTEVENIISRLNALESNKQQMKHNIAHFMEEKNEMKLLQKISEHIQNLKKLKKEGVQQPEIYMTAFQVHIILDFPPQAIDVCTMHSVF